MSAVTASYNTNRSARFERLIYPGITLVVLLAAWQATTSFALFPARFVPQPLQTARAFGFLIAHPYTAGLTLVGQAETSLLRWLVGVSAAIAAGVTFGAITAWWPWTRALTRPIFEFLRYIPPLAWVPIAIVAFGISLRAQGLIVFVGAAPPCVIATWTGIAEVRPEVIEAAALLSAGRTRTLILVVLPMAAAEILTGIRVALANGWGAIVGAELVGAQSGLGFLILTAAQSLRPDYVLAGMITIGLLGAAIDWLFRKGTQPLLRWAQITL